MCKIFAITKGVNFMEEELLFFDELTKIYNRKGFFTYTALLLEEHPGIDFCLIYWNIQQFKVLNNLFGLQTGDQILIHIADILHNEFSDQIATYGRLEADNFICCVPGSLTLRLPLDFHNSLHHSPLRLIFLSNFKILLVIVCHCVV